MATLQIERKSETHFETLCDKHLTIGTRHGISSTHENVTIEKLAHRLSSDAPRNAIQKKRRQDLLILLFFILFFFLSRCQGILCQFFEWHKVWHKVLWCATVKVESSVCYKMIS